MGGQIEPIYEPPRIGDIKDSCADITKSKDLLGSYNFVPFRHGLERTTTFRGIGRSQEFRNSYRISPLMAAQA
jgi:hypothetical protein